MPNEIRTKPIAKALLTQTLASLANAAGRQSTMVSNSSNYPAAILTYRIKSGAVAPTVGTTYDIYLIRGDDVAASTYRSDNAGATDAAMTVENSVLLGSIVVTATANKNFYIDIDTFPAGPLGPEWGTAVVNRSGQALSTTEADHLKGYLYYVPEIQ